MPHSLHPPPAVTAAGPPVAPGRSHLRTDDLDEARAWATRDSGWHSRLALDRGPLGFEMTISRGEAINVGWNRVARAQHLRGSTPRPCLHVQRAGASRYTFGRETYDVRPGQAIVLPAGWEHTRRCEPIAITALAIEHDAWQRELCARDPDLGPAAQVHPRVLDLDAAAQAPLRLAIDGLLAVAADEAAPAAQRELAEARFIGALAAALRQAAAWVHTAAIATQRLADLEQWIDAHLGEPITLGRLCEVAGVGGRSLQLAFFERRGISPLRWVTERRLRAARQELEASHRRTSVSEVALGSGFAHLGRFAVDYRKTFGETPSQTMGRRR